MELLHFHWRSLLLGEIISLIIFSMKYRIVFYWGISLWLSQSKNLASSSLIWVLFSLFEFPWISSLLFRFYLFLFLDRGERRAKERERNISVWLPLTCLSLGTWTASQACALTVNCTGDSVVRTPALNPLSHTSQGEFLLFFLLRRPDRTSPQRDTCYTLTVYRLFCIQLNGQVMSALTCRLLSMSGWGNRFCFNLTLICVL